MKRTVLLLFCSVLIAAVPLLQGGVAQAAPRVSYWLMADLVRGASGAVGPEGVQTNVFKQGEEVMFRARVLDIATGQDPGQAGKAVAALQTMGLKVTAYLDDGQSFPMKYGAHPSEGRGAAWFWTASWRIPTAYTAPHDAAELAIPIKGARYVKWWVIVTDKAGASVRFDPLGAGTTLPPAPIIIEKR